MLHNERDRQTDYIHTHMQYTYILDVITTRHLRLTEHRFRN